jgi:hypothetical protein
MPFRCVREPALGQPVLVFPANTALVCRMVPHEAMKPEPRPGVCGFVLPEHYA